MAALFLIGALLVAPVIQADIGAEVGERLHAAGVQSADVSADGQRVTIRADSDETSESVVRAIAGTTRCDTWVGRLLCPTTIDVVLLGSAGAAEQLAGRPHDIDVCNDRFDSLLAGRNVRFKTGSAAIDGGDALLRDLAALANMCPGKFAVEGHTDDRGDAEANQVLSQARAGAVVNALADLGVAADRLAAIGYGESRPIADNSTSSGRAANRRIAISTQSSN